MVLALVSSSDRDEIKLAHKGHGERMCCVLMEIAHGKMPKQIHAVELKVNEQHACSVLLEELGASSEDTSKKRAIRLSSAGRD